MRTVLLFDSSNGLLPCIQTDCGVMSSLLAASVIAAVESQESFGVFGPEGSDDQLTRSTLDQPQFSADSRVLTYRPDRKNACCGL